MSVAACSRWLSVGVTMTAVLHMPDLACVDGGENRYVLADAGEEAAGADGIGFRQGYELAGLCITGQFVYVEGVNGAHAAKARDGDFKSFSHKIFKNTMPGWMRGQSRDFVR